MLEPATPVACSLFEVRKGPSRVIGRVGHCVLGEDADHPVHDLVGRLLLHPAPVGVVLAAVDHDHVEAIASRVGDRHDRSPYVKLDVAHSVPFLSRAVGRASMGWPRCAVKRFTTGLPSAAVNFKVKMDQNTRKNMGENQEQKGTTPPHSLAASILFLLFNNHLQTRSS